MCLLVHAYWIGCPWVERLLVLRLSETPLLVPWRILATATGGGASPTFAMQGSSEGTLRVAGVQALLF